MTWESGIPTDSVKSGDDHPNLAHNTRVRTYIDSNKINLAYFVG